MPQRIKSTPALLRIKLVPMLLLVQWVGLIGSINFLNATKGWAAEETSVDSLAVSEAAESKESSKSSVANKELTSSAASEEAAPSTTATKKSSPADQESTDASAVSKQPTPATTTEKSSISPADQESTDASAAVSEAVASPAEVTKNPGSSPTDLESIDASDTAEEPATQPVGIATEAENPAIAETSKIVDSSTTNTETLVESPTATFEPEAVAQTISQAIPDSTALTPEVTSQPSDLVTETTEPEVAPDPTSIPAPVKKPVTKTNSTDNSEAYIDRTDYSIGATQPKQKSTANRPSVVLSERSTGCRAVLSAGQGVAGNLCGSKKNPALKGVAINASRATLSQSVTSSSLVKMGTLLGSGRTSTQTLSKTALPGSVVSSIPLGRSVASSSSGAGLGSFTAGLSNYSNIKVAKWFVPSNTRIIFPLAIPVAITSAFGWRLHPISGTWRFHSGTDLGAPIGTPVLAASAGKVAIANALGGYGLAVVLEHHKGTQESLYGHLSEIMVQPGAWVKQGDVIGLVGSTGNSTGPHLHFEVRQSTPQGWVAVDPGQQLETALAQLVRALQTAQASTSRAGT